MEFKEEFVSGERAEEFLKTLARDNKVRADGKLFTKLEEDRAIWRRTFTTCLTSGITTN